MDARALILPRAGVLRDSGELHDFICAICSRTRGRSCSRGQRSFGILPSHTIRFARFAHGRTGAHSPAARGPSGFCRVTRSDLRDLLTDARALILPRPEVLRDSAESNDPICAICSRTHGRSFSRGQRSFGILPSHTIRFARFAHGRTDAHSPAARGPSGFRRVARFHLRDLLTDARALILPRPEVLRDSAESNDPICAICSRTHGRSFSRGQRSFGILPSQTIRFARFAHGRAGAHSPTSRGPSGFRRVARSDLRDLLTDARALMLPRAEVLRDSGELHDFICAICSRTRGRSFSREQGSFGIPASCTIRFARFAHGRAGAHSPAGRDPSGFRRVARSDLRDLLTDARALILPRAGILRDSGELHDFICAICSRTRGRSSSHEQGSFGIPASCSIRFARFAHGRAGAHAPAGRGPSGFRRVARFHLRDLPRDARALILPRAGILRDSGELHDPICAICSWTDGRSSSRGQRSFGILPSHTIRFARFAHGRTDAHSPAARGPSGFCRVPRSDLRDLLTDARALILPRAEVLRDSGELHDFICAICPGTRGRSFSREQGSFGIPASHTIRFARFAHGRTRILPRPEVLRDSGELHDPICAICPRRSSNRANEIAAEAATVRSPESSENRSPWHHEQIAQMKSP